MDTLMYLLGILFSYFGIPAILMVLTSIPTSGE